MADTSNLSNFLGDVADAIRAKKETTEAIPAANFDTEILSIETGSDVSGVTALARDVRSSKQFVNSNGELLQGEMLDIDYTTVTTDPQINQINLNIPYTEENSYLNCYFTNRLFNYNTSTRTLSCDRKTPDGKIDSIQTVNDFTDTIIYLDVGCKNSIIDNSVIIALSSNVSLTHFYLYHLDTGKFEYYGSLNNNGTGTNIYYRCTLCPENSYISINNGYQNNTNKTSTKIYKINGKNDFSEPLFDLLLNQNNNGGTYYTEIKWIDNHSIMGSDSSNNYGSHTQSFGWSYRISDNYSYIGYSSSSKYIVYDNQNWNLVGFNDKYAIIRTATPIDNNIYTYILYEYDLTNFNVASVKNVLDELTVEGPYLYSCTMTNKFAFLSKTNASKIWIFGDTIELLDFQDLTLLKFNSKYGLYYNNNNVIYKLTLEGIEKVDTIIYDNRIYLDTSDATATSSEIFADKMAYANGEKLTGTFDYNGCLDLANTILGNIVIPDEYIKLEYIESTGTQWINTKYIPTNSIEIDMKFNCTQINNYSAIFGVRTHLKQEACLYQHTYKSNPNQKSLGLNNENIFTFDNTYMNVDTTLKLVKTGNNTGILVITDGITTDTVDISDMSCNCKYPLYLFGIYSYAYDAVHDPSYMKLYYCRINNGYGALVRHYIPVKRKSDNVAGLYDLVTKEFCTNIGTGTFLMGGEVL